MTTSIGNTTIGTDATGSVAHNNDGHTVVVFLGVGDPAYSVSSVAYGGESIEPEVRVQTQNCRLYGFLLENAPSGDNDLTYTPSGGTWYHAIYSIVDGGALGDDNGGGVSQQTAVHAIVSTQDTDSMVLTAVIRRFNSGNVLTDHNMTQDDERVFFDGRAAAGHAQGTGGNVDAYWSWSSTEDAVAIAIEVLMREISSSPPLAVWWN